MTKRTVSEKSRARFLKEVQPLAAEGLRRAMERRAQGREEGRQVVLAILTKTTGAALARALGVDRAVVRRWVTGERPVPAKYLVILQDL